MSVERVRPLTWRHADELDTVLFKTQLCWFFQNGVCRRRICRFGHGEAELRAKPNLIKTRMCHFLTDRGSCRERDCKFAHNIDELRPVANASTDGRYTQQRMGHPEPWTQVVAPQPLLDYSDAKGARAPIPSASQHAPHLPDVIQIDFLQYHSAGELMNLFRAIPADQLIMAHPVVYYD